MSGAVRAAVVTGEADGECGKLESASVCSRGQRFSDPAKVASKGRLGPSC